MTERYRWLEGPRFSLEEGTGEYSDDDSEVKLSERNRHFYEELVSIMGDQNEMRFTTPEGTLTLKFLEEVVVEETGDRYLKVEFATKERIESYGVFAMGLFDMKVSGNEVRIKTELGIDYQLQPGSKFTIQADDEAYPEEFCNQIEQIVESVKKIAHEPKINK